MRRLLVVPAAAVAVCLAPGAASADVIFDPADADELAATLADAYEAQGVCYGWSVDVNNVNVPETSVGSNFGAGQPLRDRGECAKSVEFQADITWTSESSESEDSASYQVVSTPSGPSTSDLDSLDIISEDGLAGDNVDSDVYKAVAALPLLAADAGIAEPIEASPAPESDAGDAVPTDSPGSDFWRQSGMQVLWGVVLLLGAVAFGWYAIRAHRRTARPRAVGPSAEQIPEYVPPQWSPPPPDEPAAGPPGDPGDEPAGDAGPAGDPPDPPGPGQPGKPAGKPDPDTRPEE